MLVRRGLSPRRVRPHAGAGTFTSMVCFLHDPILPELASGGLRSKNDTKASAAAASRHVELCSR